jgi:GNAT superfamily N-acetyltransferase
MTVAATIRSASEADVQSIAGVYLAARRAAGGRFPRSVHDDAELVPHLLDDVFPVADVQVAERDGRVVGVLILSGPLIDWLFVAPEAQGSGIGTALLERAKAERPGGLRLWVFASNVPAEAFYERHGFRVVGGSDGSANEEGAPDLLLAWEGAGRPALPTANRGGEHPPAD